MKHRLINIFYFVLSVGIAKAQPEGTLALFGPKPSES